MTGRTDPAYRDPWQAGAELAAARATEWCISCDTRRSRSELLEVVDLRTGEPFYVCRPGEGRLPCVRLAIGPRDVHRIVGAADRVKR